MSDLPLKSVCVFCGSNVGARPDYASAARDLGTELVARDFRLVYGGGNVGLMGVIADAVLDAGGHVTGVIPQALAQKELAHPRAQEMHVVGSMHERKAMMSDLSDGFIAMPGGLGTLEEFFEVLTWAQLGFHRKPVGLLNPESFFNPLLAFIDAACEESFIRWSHRQIIISSDQPSEILDMFQSYQAPAVDKWIDRKSL